MAAANQGTELRRVQRLGGSSLVVTIPKQWARKMNIKPGDEVAVIEEGDSLKITPLRTTPRHNGAFLRVKLNRQLYSLGAGRIAWCAYITGYSGVVIEWNPKSVRIEYGEVLESVEKTVPVARIVEARMGRVIVAFEEGGGAAPVYLRALGALLSTSLREGHYSDGKIELMAAHALRVAGPEGKGLLALIPPLLELAGHVPEGREASKLAYLVAEVFGGASVGSVRRLSDAIEELESMIDTLNTSGKVGVTLAMAILLKWAALSALCDAITGAGDSSV